MKHEQKGQIEALRFAYWSSMYQYDAPAFTLKKIGWIQVGNDFCFSVPEGNDMILLLYCLEGSSTSYTKKGIFTISPGEALIYNIRDGYHAESISDNHKFILIYMSGMFANSVLKHLEKDRGNLFFATPDIIPICEKIYELASHNWSYSSDIQISHLLYELLGKLLIPFNKKYNTEPAVRYIHKYYMKKITTSHLAELCHMEDCHFIRCFKQDYGITPHKYIINYRISEAQKLLLKTDLPISVISLKTGFDDTSYFSRVFKKQTSCLPHTFRKFPYT